MIPVRVPVTAAVHVVSIPEIPEGHGLYGTPCPACGGPLAGPAALVYVGAHPEDRKPAGWMTGGSVAVHPECAGITRALCRTCDRTIGYTDSPTGGWWRHDQHPADGHDAVPGMVAPADAGPADEVTTP